MSDDNRDTDRARDAQASVARDFLDLARRSGNTNMTYDDARRRVSDAVRIGDRKRENGNR